MPAAAAVPAAVSTKVSLASWALSVTLSAASLAYVDAVSVAESTAEPTEEDSPSADEGELASSLAKRLNTDGEIPVACTFDLRRKGEQVLMERD